MGRHMRRGTTTAILALALGWSWDARAATLYYCTSNGIYTVDTVTGAAALAFSITGASLLDLSESPYQGILYAADTSGRELYAVDIANQTASVVGPFGSAINGMALDVANQILYATDYANLYVVDQVTGDATLVGSFGGPTQMWAFGYDPATLGLFGVDANTDLLYAIDKSTGAASVIGPTGVDRVTDLDFYQGVTYAIGNGCCNYLYRVDMLSGAMTRIGSAVPGSPVGLAADAGTQCSGVSIFPTTLPDAVEGGGYSQAFVPAGSYSIVFGALPSGFTLSTAGVLSGTTWTSGTYTFTVKVVENVTLCVGFRAYTLRVNACPVTIAPTQPSLPAGDTAVPYTATLTASGGTPPYTFSVIAGGLPAGLVLNAAGVISGTPSLPGTFGFTAKAEDATCADTRDYTILIRGGSNPDNLVVGPGFGPGNANQARVYRHGATGASSTFFAYGAGAWGLNVASGNMTGDPRAQILTGPGPGDVFGPQARGFIYNGTGMGKVNFYAYGTLKFGVNVSSAELDADGLHEILTGPGPGAIFGPHVRAWNFDNATLGAISKVNFYAYATLRFGVNVNRANVEADAYDEILTGAGPGAVFGSVVRGFNYDGTAVTAMGKINFAAFTGASFGAGVAGSDVDEDGFGEILATPGPGPGNPPRFLGFDIDGATLGPLPGFDVTLPTSSGYGGRVGAAEINGDGAGDLLAGAGPDPTVSARVYPHAYDASTLWPLVTFDPFPTYTHGVNVSGGDIGF